MILLKIRDCINEMGGGDELSILIKDMKMPECCFRCPCCSYVNNRDCYVCDFTENIGYPEIVDVHEIEDWCPLVEIPTPHGRLIDENELCNKIMDEFRGVCSYDVSPSEAESDFMSIVDNCKTIVKAEE